MEKTEFRIIERHLDDGSIHFIPERTKISTQSFRNYDWVNISYKDYSYYTTYEDALKKIKEFINKEHVIKSYSIVHNLNELTMIYNEGEYKYDSNKEE